MGNRLSVAQDNDDDEAACGVPESSIMSSNDSSSSSSSSSSDASSSSASALKMMMMIDPYSDEDNDEQVNAASASTSTATSSSSTSNLSECYRLPLFTKKSDPLTVLTSDDDENEDDNDEETISCLPRSTKASSFSCLPSSSMRQNWKRSASSSLLLSFNDHDDDHDDEEDLLDSSESSFFGCVTSPLSKTHSSHSWTNAMQLDSSGDHTSSDTTTSTTTTSKLAYTQEERDMVDGDLATPASDLTPPRHYWIVTTAALPWMTGTAVNPLLRAAYLSQRNRALVTTTGACGTETTTTTTVTLVLPWLESSKDRIALYGTDWKDATPQDQEAFIRNWLCDSAGLPLESNVAQGGIGIQWYPARYHAALSSIFAMGDLCALIPQAEATRHDMICILEEPEHVNFYRAPGRLSWRDKFPHVIGIVHTNYKAYARNHYSGLLTGPLVGALSALMVSAYCDKVVKLSPVLQTYAPEKEVVSNVHGIRHEFFTCPTPSPSSSSKSRCYFIGKLLWAKGLDKLLELQACYKKATGRYWPMDIFGTGPQQDEIQAAFLGQDYFKNQDLATTPTTTATTTASTTTRRYWRRFRQPIPATFLGRRDHASIGSEYKIFVNPSITEVLCTTTAEAVAMGKWVIVPKHASNEFFRSFANCLQYTSRQDFVKLLHHAMSHEPPCTSTTSTTTTTVANTEEEEDRSALFPSLTWQAATDRLIHTAHLSQRDARRCERLQSKDKSISIQEWHYALGTGLRGDVLRKVLGGGPVAEQSQYAATTASMSATSLSGYKEQEPPVCVSVSSS
jgi:digalactosyldiacylglycerol synthase